MIRVTVMAGEGTYSVFEHENVDFYTTPLDGYLHLYSGGRFENDSSPVITYQKNSWLKVEYVNISSDSS